METIPYKATRTPRDSLPKVMEELIFLGRIKGRRHRFTHSPVTSWQNAHHALRIRGIQTSLVSPACSPQSLGNRGDIWVGDWLFHRLLPEVLKDGGNPTWTQQRFSQSWVMSLWSYQPYDCAISFLVLHFLVVIFVPWLDHGGEWWMATFHLLSGHYWALLLTSWNGVFLCGQEGCLSLPTYRLNRTQWHHSKDRLSVCICLFKWNFDFSPDLGTHISHIC